MIDAITAAAAGVGMPTKYFELPGAIPCTLNRASRHAQQTKNARQQTQPNSPKREIAARMGPFSGYSLNSEHMLRVLNMHRVEAALEPERADRGAG